ncbi:hypothetical protein RUM43_007307 [Polyplax serrata]|uniref:Uncharacterized protein n=1 Tax=Polyplax serrata TaxID=468196 RepID=A0AAN8PX09_POLSC
MSTALERNPAVLSLNYLLRIETKIIGPLGSDTNSFRLLSALLSCSCLVFLISRLFNRKCNNTCDDLLKYDVPRLIDRQICVTTRQKSDDSRNKVVSLANFRAFHKAKLIFFTDSIIDFIGMPLGDLPLTVLAIVAEENYCVTYISACVLVTYASNAITFFKPSWKILLHMVLHSPQVASGAA